MAAHANATISREPWSNAKGDVVGFGQWMIVCTDCDADSNPDHAFEIKRVRRLRFPPDDVAEAEAVLASHRSVTADW